VDKKKIEQKFYNYEESNVSGSFRERLELKIELFSFLLQDVPKPRIPIIHFSNATPPFVLCVKLVSVVRV